MRNRPLNTWNRCSIVLIVADAVAAALSGSGIYHIIGAQLGARAGIRARPHGLRHTAITSALDAFNGDYRKTRAFSRLARHGEEL